MEVPGSQLRLDVPLTLEQPIHRVIEIVLAGVNNAESRWETCDLPPAVGLQLARRPQDPRRDQSQHQTPLPGRPRSHQIGEPEPPHGEQHRIYVPVVERRSYFEYVLG